ncbi:MAG: prephenate dehydrogenase/arogenate dehydrogenase family protein [Pyrobaculum sp.]
MAKVGIIGGGAMGGWLRREISHIHQTLTHDIDRSKSDVDLHTLLNWAEVVIVAVSFWNTAQVLREIAPMSEGKLVMDISTFKEEVAKAYLDYPPHAKVATVHPMFGPGAPTLKGQRVLVMEIPGRTGGAEAFRFWKELGAEVEWGDLAKHDYYVSRTIALSYAVGLALARIYEEIGEEAFRYGGTSFRYLATYAFSLLKDPSAVRYAELAPVEEFIEALRDKRLPKPLQDPEEAYRKFYKALASFES